MIDPNSHTGAIRTAVQTFFGSLIVTATPILEALDITEEVNALSSVLTSLIVSLFIGLYWFIFNWAQTSPKVQENPTLKFIVTVLMGGNKTPSYRDVGGPSIGDGVE